MAFTQENRMFTLESPLGKDELLSTAFRGTEGMSRLFRFEVVALSHDQAINFEKIVGKNVTLALVLQDGSERYFNGIVSRFSQAGAGHQQDREVHFTEYTMTVVPWLWLLTLTEDSKIFQDKTVPEIVEAVFQRRGFQKGKDYAFRLHGSYDKRVYCVQYRETDFHFVSRLLEDEGIHYFFEHEKKAHTLVIADDPVENKPCPRQETARYQRAAGGAADEDFIREFQQRMEVVPTAFTLKDYNFEIPKTNLEVNAPSNRKLTDRDCEVYDYPGCYQTKTKGDRFANIRMQSEEATIDVFTGVGTCRAFTAGQRFELKDYYRADLNDKRYVLTGILHEGSQSLGLAGEGGDVFRYKNEFTCIPHEVPFRPPWDTPRPVVRGTQTAVVVGPSGEEIYTDKHGRIKVQFHWDREGKRDENSSCWIRVGQLWAGSGWGGVFIPRIGQEVIVDFLEGDPDQPIITGRVYNADEMPPYELPKEQTKSTVKSLSSKDGGGFNEIRFEDKKGEEQVFIHGEKDLDVRIKNDRREWIGRDRHLVVKRDKVEEIDRDEHVVVKRDLVEKVTRDHHLSVTGKEAIQITGSHSLAVQGDVIEEFKMNHSEQVTMNYSVKGMNVVIEGMTGLTIKVGGSFITLNPAGVQIVGPMLMLNSGGAPLVGMPGMLVSPAAPLEANIADNADPGSKDASFKSQRAAMTPEQQSAADAPSHDPSTPENKQKKSWIEIELMDQDNKPVPGEKYRITLPDGTTVAEGTLDNKGFARVDNIDPGTCKVTFPNLDKQSWKPK